MLQPTNSNGDPWIVEVELVDEFGRTLEEQLVDVIIWGHMLDRDQHHIREDYVSDDLYQDSEEDLPLGFYVTYDSGPEYSIFDFDDENRAEWHKDTAIELLEEEGYNALLEELVK